MNSNKNLLKILSDETRLRVLNLLIKCKTNLCVCELVDSLKIPQYAVSKAITQIRKAELLSSVKESTWIYYQLDYSKNKNKLLLEFLEKFLADEVYKEDENRLFQRLKLRENQKCVVGIISEEKLIKKYREKIKA